MLPLPIMWCRVASSSLLHETRLHRGLLQHNDLWLLWLHEAWLLLRRCLYDNGLQHPLYLVLHDVLLKCTGDLLLGRLLWLLLLLHLLKTHGRLLCGWCRLSCGQLLRWLGALLWRRRSCRNQWWSKSLPSLFVKCIQPKRTGRWAGGGHGTAFALTVQHVF